MSGMRSAGWGMRMAEIGMRNYSEIAETMGPHSILLKPK